MNRISTKYTYYTVELNIMHRTRSSTLAETRGNAAAAN